MKSTLPTVYAHRIGEVYPHYMTPENENFIKSFSNFRSGGSRDVPYSKEELLRELEGAEVILSLNGTGSDEITTEILKEVGTIKLAVISHWYHIRHGISKPLWEAAGVKVVEGAVANTEAVAEWTVASMLMGLRNLPYYNRSLKGGADDLWGDARKDSRLLCESKIGLIGLGRIGLQVATLLKPFGSEIQGFDPFVSQETAAQYNIKLKSLDEVLHTSDVVSIHLPVNDKTRGIFTEREFKLIKDGAVFLNCARGALLDFPAFMKELSKARFSAFIDVFDKEPLPADHPIRKMDHVFITPHIAGFSKSAQERCARQAISTLQDYFEGKLKLF